MSDAVEVFGVRLSRGSYVPAVVFGLITILVDSFFKSNIPSAVINRGILVIPQSDAVLVLAAQVVLILFLGLYGLGRYFRREKEAFDVTIIIFVLIVAASNLIDRITVGGVIDYIKLGNLSFNLSDVVITGTVVLVVIFTLRNAIYERSKRNSS